jgi:hypothetical protein
MSRAVVPRRGTFAGLFLVCMATLLDELLLTRVFSVTMWYHFAFVAVSVAMFGMTVGAIVVYLRPDTFPPDAVHRQLAAAALLFAASLVPSFLSHLVIPFAPQPSVLGLYSVALTYTLISIPFIFSGIVVSLALSRFPNHLGRLYAADLIGAALACLLFVSALRLTDATTLVVATAALAGVASLCFGGWHARRMLAAALALEALLLVWVSYGTWRAWQGYPLVRLWYVKGTSPGNPLYEKWNSFSRLAVSGWALPEAPFGWGMSTTLDPQTRVRQLGMNIDGAAATVLTNFDGDPTTLDFLKYDVVNLAHHLRPSARVLVVGVGGGRDILSALAFHQREVVGVEINDDILDILAHRYGDFTGHLERQPTVRFVNDEARSWVARTDERFDIIQVSLIDTWAATAASAFTFTENALYTVEAWKLFLRRLTPSGVMTFSRWCYGELPAETYRMVSLAAEALRQSGIAEPRRHILLVRPARPHADQYAGVATILVGRQPFGDADLVRLREVAATLQFEILLTPTEAANSTLAALANPAAAPGLLDALPMDLSAPTDDRPFFFHTLRWRNLFRQDLYVQGVTAFNTNAVFILAALLVATVGLTALCVLAPLVLTANRQVLRGSAALFVFFGAIGIGFMLIEISQMQRLNVFLGHPTYGLTVALFSLLLSSGIGSYTTSLGRALLGARTRLVLLLAALVTFGLLTPPMTRWFSSASTPLRIVVAAGMLAPPGFFLGMAFPLGMEVAVRRTAALAPWLWGINGAASVCASVVALVIALTWGISAAFWCGFLCYLAALAAYLRVGGVRTEA